jgi:biotin operon repressor
VLLRTAVLERIVRGEVSLVFRRWRRPTVRSGGSLRTALGVLRILDVSLVTEADISETDAARAGFPSRGALLDGLGSREGPVYRIGVEFGGADPRIALRQQDDVSDAEIAQVIGRLQRLDAGSPTGPWTARVLAAIEEQPRVVARTLAERLGYERDWLKRAVRKLKNLGLTISLTKGYELSPRGRVVLDQLCRTGPGYAIE